MQLISIIGFGWVGRTLAFGLLESVDHDFILNVIDHPDQDISGSVLDISHAAQLSKHCKHIAIGDSTLLQRSTIVFHCAGPHFPIGTSRMSVAQESVALTKSIFDGTSFENNPWIIVIANPVDVVTYYSWKYGGVDREKVMSTGTFLDTIRLRYYLSRRFDMEHDLIYAECLGEHGRSAVPIIKGAQLDDTKRRSDIKWAIESTLNAADSIRKTQEYTYYGVCACALRMYASITGDQELNVPIGIVTDSDTSDWLHCDRPISLSLPARLVNGVGTVQRPTLTPEQLQALRQSAHLIYEHTYSVEIS